MQIEVTLDNYLPESHLNYDENKIFTNLLSQVQKELRENIPFILNNLQEKIEIYKSEEGILLKKRNLIYNDFENDFKPFEIKLLKLLIYIIKIN